MRKFLNRLCAGLLFGALAAAIICNGTARAAPIGGSVDVAFQNGRGTVSGYFQTNNAGAISSWDLTTSEYDCNPCGLSTGFPGIEYVPSTSTIAVGFFNGNQSITFHDTSSGFQLDFVIDCGGGGTNCIANATLGSTLSVTGDEVSMPDFLPYRAFTSAILIATDPLVGLSFNLAPAAVPEPATLTLLGLSLLGFAAYRKYQA